MDHLPRMSTSIPEELRVPYLCNPDSTSRPDFWEYPENHGWDRQGLELGLDKHGSLALLRSKFGKGLVTGDEIAALLQDWWYFGLLSQVLQIDIRHADFILFSSRDDSSSSSDHHGKGLTVTTARLGEYLHAWETRLAAKGAEQAMSELQAAKECVDYVHQKIEALGRFVENFVSKENSAAKKTTIAGLRRSTDGRVSVSDSALQAIISRGDQVQGSHGLDATILIGARRGGRRPDAAQVAVFEALELTFWSTKGRQVLPENLEIGICILGHTLSHTIKTIKSRLGLSSTNERDDRTSHPGWYTPGSVPRRLRDSGLCPRLISRLQPRLFIVGMFLASVLTSESHAGEAGEQHKDCTSTRCSADYLSKDTSPRRHYTSSCACGNFPPLDWYAKVLCVLESGKIPVVRLRRTKDKLDVEVLSSTDMPYVALSHIWSDGLGNEKHNQIYECQWSRLQNLVDHLFPDDPEEEESVPFWLDTICVPMAADANCPDLDRRKRMRNYAIERMRETYQQAKSVIVLDGTMLGLQASGLSTVEFGLRFSFSRWVRRLWTMHEGAVAQYGRVFVRVADGTVRLAGVAESLSKVLDAEATDRNRPLLSSLGAVEAYQSWFSTLHLRETLSGAQDLQYLFSYAWNESRNRATKYEEDRYVVIASLLGLGKPQNLYDCETTEARMLHLFQKFDPASIPANVLFCAGGRLTVPGYRWAPSSLDHEELLVQDLPAPTRRIAEGLVVEYPGWRLDRHPDWSRRYRLTGSLWTEEVKLSPNAGPDGTSLGTCSWAIRTRPGDAIHTVNFSTNDSTLPRISDGDSLVIIQKPYTRRGGSLTHAVLAVEKHTGLDGLIHVHYVASLYWTFVSAEDMTMLSEMATSGIIDLCDVSPVGDGRTVPRWCVD